MFITDLPFKKLKTENKIRKKIKKLYRSNFSILGVRVEVSFFFFFFSSIVVQLQCCLNLLFYIV